MKISRPRLVPLVFALIAAVALVGCDSTGSSPNNSGTVKVSFSTASSSTQSTTALAKAASDSLVLSGSNGTLTITDIRLIVDKVKLKQNTDSTGANGAEIEIEREVEVEQPRFLDLPLQKSKVSPVAAGDIPAGTYDEFEFEVDDLDDDSDGEGDDDADDEGNVQGLLTDIRKEFPNWPKDASMIVIGTFTPTGGTPTSFSTYFEAEIEVEQMLTPPIEVNSEGFSRELIVRLDPARWFERSNGTIKDLSQFDYGETGTVKELEAEFEQGVAEIEYGN
ncbi:MAG: hypothetical protein ABEL51_02280 [Salinibacter sp.]